MTRQIDTKLVAALKAGRAFTSTNTTYNPVSGAIALFGNVIARVSLNNAGSYVAIEFNLCDWNTPTTRSRLSTIAAGGGGSGVYCVGGVPMQGLDRVPTTGWFRCLTRDEHLDQLAARDLARRKLAEARISKSTTTA